MTAWLKIAAVVLEAAVAILAEWFAARKRAREEQKAYELNEAEKARLIDAAVTRMREAAREESRRARDVEDRVDADRPKPGV